MYACAAHSASMLKLPDAEASVPLSLCYVRASQCIIFLYTSGCMAFAQVP